MIIGISQVKKVTSVVTKCFGQLLNRKKIQNRNKKLGYFLYHVDLTKTWKFCNKLSNLKIAILQNTAEKLEPKLKCRKQEK